MAISMYSRSVALLNWHSRTSTINFPILPWDKVVKAIQHETCLKRRMKESRLIPTMVLLVLLVLVLLVILVNLVTLVMVVVVVSPLVLLVVVLVVVLIVTLLVITLVVTLVVILLVALLLLRRTVNRNALSGTNVSYYSIMAGIYR